MPDEPLGLDLAEPVEDVAVLEDFVGDAVELVEIDGPAQLLDGGLGVVPEELLGVPVGEPVEAAQLGGEEQLVGLAGGKCLEEAADEGLAMPAAVDVGSVDKGDAAGQRQTEDLKGGIVGNLPQWRSQAASSPGRFQRRGCRDVVRDGIS